MPVEVSGMRKPFHFKPEPVREPQIPRARILAKAKLCIENTLFQRGLVSTLPKDKLVHLGI